MKRDLSIELLGRITITMDGLPVSDLEPPRLRALLARLVLSPGIAIERSVLSFDFWPDSTDRQARTNLRKLLHQLQQRLPRAELFLQSDNHRVLWRHDAPCRVDVHDFISGTEPGSSPRELKQAINVYGGPLLPGFYDEWILAERERLQGMYLDALDRLASFYEHQGQFAPAAGLLEQRLQEMPYDEPSWERLIRLHAAAGNRAGALAAYDRCSTVLSEELGAEPSDAIVSIYKQLQRAAAGPRSDGTGTTKAARLLPEALGMHLLPIVGRHREFSVVRRWCYEALNENHPTLVLLSGEAGIGKTRLAEEVVGWVLAQGVAVATAHAYEPDQAMAFTPIQGLLRNESLRSAVDTLAPPWRREIARLLRDLPEADPDSAAAAATAPLRLGASAAAWRRQELFEAVTQTLLAVQQPLLLAVDDLQWWDRASVTWLHYLFSHLRDVPLVVLATLRPEEDPAVGFPELMAALQSRDRLRQIELGPLTYEHCHHLIEELADRQEDTYFTEQTASGEQALTPAFAEQAYVETGGNPLFLVEWVQAQWAGLGGDTVTGSYVDPVSGLPGRIHGIIMSRLLALSPPSRQLADAAAILGRAFAWELPQAMTELDDEATVHALEELGRRRVLQEHDDGVYDFTHGRIRDVVAARLSTARRRFLHKRAAIALRSLYGDDNDAVAIRLAEHYEQAGNPLEAAIHYELAAAYALSVYANEEAMALYRYGLEALTARDDISTGTGPDVHPASVQAALWEGLGDVQLHVGQHDEAQQAFSRAAALLPRSPNVARATVLRKKGNTARASQHYEDAETWYNQAENVLSRLCPDMATADSETLAAWVDVRLDRLNLLYGAGRIDEMHEISEQMKPIISQSPGWDHQTRYHHALATMLHRKDRFVTSDETLAHGEAQLQAARAANDRRLEAEARFSLGFLMLWRGDASGAAPYLQTALKWAETTGDLLLQLRTLLYLGFLRRRQRDVEEVRALSSQALELARRAGFNEYIAAGLAHRAWIALRDGDGDQARRDARKAIQLWDDGSLVYPFQWAAVWPLLALELEKGRSATAFALASGF